MLSKNWHFRYYTEINEKREGWLQAKSYSEAKKSVESKTDFHRLGNLGDVYISDAAQQTTEEVGTTTRPTANESSSNDLHTNEKKQPKKYHPKTIRPFFQCLSNLDGLISLNQLAG